MKAQGRIKPTRLSLLIAGILAMSQPVMAETAVATEQAELIADVASLKDMPATSAKEAVQKAIATNPEVEAAWHLFNASVFEEKEAEGRYLPSIDLVAGLGHQSNQMHGQRSENYWRETIGIILEQNIFEGFATVNEIARLNYNRLSRYYDFMQASSNTALEAVTYYEEVLKQRELLALATENFKQHKVLTDAILNKVATGLGRAVDLELATGRLALAQSNLLTEASNLHDVSAKYQNVVGELPADDLLAMDFADDTLPADLKTALSMAYEASPEFNSVLEQVRAAEAEYDLRDAPFMPKLDFRASHTRGTNVGGLQNRDYDQVYELVASYNIYNGGSDFMQKERFRERLSFARQNREKICTNIRQELTVALNDVAQLSERLTYLNQHQLSTSKAREAYKAQFDIGQRTLLDLLDTENEYFQAKRNYIAAQHDLVTAKARSLHNTGHLLLSLGVQREQLPTMEELRQDRDLAQNAEYACPTELVSPVSIDRTGFVGVAR